MLRIVRNYHFTEDDAILEGYAAMIHSCIGWAVREAKRPKPVMSSVKFLDEFIPNWRELYQVETHRLTS